MRDAKLDRDRVTIFQSAFFSGQLPVENADFVDVRTVEAVGKDREASLTVMREEMVSSRTFEAAVSWGVWREYSRRSQFSPAATLGLNSCLWPLLAAQLQKFTTRGNTIRS